MDTITQNIVGFSGQTTIVSIPVFSEGRQAKLDGYFAHINIFQSGVRVYRGQLVVSVADATVSLMWGTSPIGNGSYTYTIEVQKMWGVAQVVASGTLTISTGDSTEAVPAALAALATGNPGDVLMQNDDGDLVVLPARLPVGSQLMAEVNPDNQKWFLCNGQILSRQQYADIRSQEQNIWTNRSLPSSYNWAATAYGFGLFIMIASNGAQCHTSPTGATWTQRTIHAGMNAAILRPNNLIVAVGEGTNASYTQNGTTWTQVVLPVSGSWTKLGTANNKVMAVANSSNNGLITSDGANWTQITLPASAAWSAVVGVGTSFLLFDYAGNCYRTTDDGQTWTTQTDSPVGSYTAVAATTGTRVIAFGFNNANCAVSDDYGVTWTTYSIGVADRWSKSHWNGSVYIVRADQVGSTLAYSYDGETWEYDTNLPTSGVPYSDFASDKSGITFVAYTGYNQGATSPLGFVVMPTIADNAAFHTYLRLVP